MFFSSLVNVSCARVWGGQTEEDCCCYCCALCCHVCFRRYTYDEARASQSPTRYSSYILQPVHIRVWARRPLGPSCRRTDTQTDGRPPSTLKSLKYRFSLVFRTLSSYFVCHFLPSLPSWHGGARKTRGRSISYFIYFYSAVIIITYDKSLIRSYAIDQK